MEFKKILLCLFTISSLSYGGDLQQSSSSIDWKALSNEYVKVIYSKELKNESIYVANLIKYYASIVGKTYEMKRPKQFTLVLRPEKSDPNGFVTLGPRRSEWFSNSTFSSSVGSLEWLQILAIHEFRHIIQFDYINTSTAKLFDFLFGDNGRFLAAGMGYPNWFFEGDAVWAETKYSDAGRGRSPRFTARLRGLLSSGQIPTYDEFLIGTYNTYLPNRYVYGYILITSAIKKFGDDFWRKVAKSVSELPIPLRFYSSFETVSGQKFSEFYRDTFKELKSQWNVYNDKEIKGIEYSERLFPVKIRENIFSLRYDLNSYWSIYKQTGKKEEIVTEIPFSKDSSRIHFRNDKAIYNQILSDSRYGYKESSDLILVDLITGQKTKITENKRYFNAILNKQSNKILAVQFTKKNNWILIELDLSGKELRKIYLQNLLFVEASYVKANEVIAIVSNKIGEKSVIRLNLKTSKYTTLLTPSRNSIGRLSIDKRGNIFIEAQLNGKIDIFKISNNEIYNCSNSRFSASTPFSDGGVLYYSSEFSFGSKIVKRKLDSCVKIDKKSLVNYRYLGNSPSDNYGNFKLKKFSKHKEMFLESNETPYVSSDYNHIEKRLFIPHSWQFSTLRGPNLSVFSDNYLGTLGITANIGKDAEEGKLKTELKVSIKKYYPVFDIVGSVKEREVDIYNYLDQLSWDEKDISLYATIPYIYEKNLYTTQSNLTFGLGYLDTTNYKLGDIKVSRGNQFFYESSVLFTTSVSKKLRSRSLVSPWSFDFTLSYDNVKNPKNKKASSYQFYRQVKVRTPGFFNHDGLEITYDEENQKKSIDAYRFAPIISSNIGYVFSRGYGYVAVSNYTKVSANYIFPISYPDFEVGSGWFYLKRIYGSGFYDSTKIKGLSKSLDSFGGELIFESTLFRLLPVDLGIRYFYLKNTRENQKELFLSTGLSF